MTGERITAATITPEVLADLRRTAEAAIAADESDEYDPEPGRWEADVWPVRRRGARGQLLAIRESDGTMGSVSCIATDGVYGMTDGRTAEHIATFDPCTVLAILDLLEPLS